MDRETYALVAETARNIKLPASMYPTVSWGHPNASDRWAIRWRMALLQLAKARGEV